MIFYQNNESQIFSLNLIKLVGVKRTDSMYFHTPSSFEQDTEGQFEFSTFTRNQLNAKYSSHPTMVTIHQMLPSHTFASNFCFT